MANIRWVVIPCLLLVILVTGCSPILTPAQSMQTTEAVLQSETSLGQSFVATHSGLAGMEFYLTPDESGDGVIVLHLRNEPGASDDLAASRLPVEAVDTPGMYRFGFNPIENSRRQDYYAFLELRGEGQVGVGVTYGYTYLDGAFYQNHSPQEGQLTFTLVYDRLEALSGILRQGWTWAVILMMGVFLYILPGWAILRGLWRGWEKFGWVEKTALSAGLSLAIIPLLFLWTDTFDLHLGAVYAWLPGTLALIALIWMNRRSLKSISLRGMAKRDWKAIILRDLPDIVLVIILLIIIAGRLWTVSNLDLPMWGDSYQHTVIVQLMLDNGGLFDSWEPYAPLETLTYHYGFHADTAVFGWLANLPATRAIIWAGQLLNILAVLAVYPLAVRLGGNRWAGVGAVVLAGLCFPIPMSYVNWGRYTQLAGQTILPAFALLFLDALKSDRASWRRIAVLAIALSGLALTHYRILIFALAIFPVYLVLETRRKNLVHVLSQIALIGAASLILFLPWFIHVYGNRILTILQSQLTTLPSASPVGLEQYNSIGNIFTYLPAWAWLTVLLVVGTGLWLRKEGVAFISLWWFLILLIANPAWLNLPGTGTLSNFAVFIAAYIPVSILLGAGVGWLMEYLSTTSQRSAGIAAMACAVVLLGVAVWGGKERLADVRIQEFSLATRPDVNAAAWIRENTPEDAKFVVNSFFSYLDTLIVGADGGWWLPLLTQRQTNLPPLTYGIEDSSGDEYMLATNELARDIEEQGITDPVIVERLLEAGFEYVYVGQRQGAVNNPNPTALDPQLLRNDPHFETVYQGDRVWIFKIVP